MLNAIAVNIARAHILYPNAVRITPRIAGQWPARIHEAAHVTARAINGVCRYLKVIFPARMTGGCGVARAACGMRPATAACGSRSNACTEEFVVVGWADPEGSRPWLGALLLAYYDPDGSLVYAGRAGTGIKQAELERLWRRLQPLAVDKMPLEVPPPRTSRFGSPLVFSRVPELVARSNVSPGPTTTCCGRSFTRACASTSRRPKTAARCRFQTGNRTILASWG